MNNYPWTTIIEGKNTRFVQLRFCSHCKKFTTFTTEPMEIISGTFAIDYMCMKCGECGK